MNTKLAHGLTALLAFSLAACAQLNPSVDMPKQTTALPVAAPAIQAAPTGGLYNVAQFRPLFEDQRARFVGDTITVQITERINAEQKNSVSATRSDSTRLTLPRIPGLFLGQGALKAVDKTASSDKDFSGEGESKAANNLTGTITATVSEILPNGHLRVVGEKQIGTNRDVETLKFSGVVNPATIGAGNIVQSTRIADARVEYKGQGGIDAATTMGWLSRIFLSVLPF